MPTVKEFEAMAENDEKIKQDLEKALEESKKVQEDMKKMGKSIAGERPGLAKPQGTGKTLERQKELEKQIEQAQKSFEENRKNQGTVF